MLYLPTQGKFKIFVKLSTTRWHCNAPKVHYMYTTINLLMPDSTNSIRFNLILDHEMA